MRSNYTDIKSMRRTDMDTVASRTTRMNIACAAPVENKDTPQNEAEVGVGCGGGGECDAFRLGGATPVNHS